MNVLRLKPFLFACAAVIILFNPPRHARADGFQTSLAGPWRFQLDPQDVGLKDGWFQRELA
jgi:hypothetical protein